MFRVIHDSSVFIGYESIPFSAIRRGYRVVHLHDQRGIRKGDMAFATLLVRISIVSKIT